MKVLLSTLMCAAILFALTGRLSAQNVGGSTISLLLPSGATRVVGSKAAVLVYEGQSNSRSTQLDAIGQIKALLKGGPSNLASSARSDVYDALSEIAMSGTGRPAVAGNSVFNSFPLVRLQACHELGAIGGKRAVTILTRVLNYDDDSLVLAEAAFQLGRLKQNAGNSVSNAIVAALRRTPQNQGESIFAYTAITALGQLAKVNKGHPDAGVYLAIQDVGRMGYSQRVDNAAAAALQRVVTYG